LVATVVGSGIMAETLTKDVALALLGNTLPTGAILVVLISILGPVSGAHFNPAVSLVFALKGELTPRHALGYVAAQVAGGIAGTMIAHAMFALPLIDASLKTRTGGAQWFAEGVAAFGLVATILAGIRFNRTAVPWLVGLYITGGLLVHGLDLVCQSCGSHRALDDQYVFGHSPRRSSRLHRGRILRRGRRADFHELAAARGRRGGKDQGGPAMTVTIYHNPACGTSRNTLAMIRQSGEEPEVIEYLKTPPSRARLVELIVPSASRHASCCAKKARPMPSLACRSEMERRRTDRFHAAHPILINRPIVVTPKGRAAVPAVGAGARPARQPVQSFVKEGRRGGARARRVRGARLLLVTIARHNGVWNSRPVCALMNWLVSQGLTGLPENDLIRGFCERCCAEGLPVSRGMVFIDTLHPIFEGRGFRWNDAETNESDVFEYGSTNEGEARRPGGVRSSITCSKTATRNCRSSSPTA
jgi:arsenate reductase (glutaredoxin)